ncbi:MAG: hypothetical protein FJ264_04975 [Planctomycetes bacterium]|nr:hypothetical protein [Planctomycetota bacterium]
MEEHEKAYYQNRRGKPDFLIKSLKWFVVISWLLMVTALLIFGAAIPEVESFFDRKFDMKLISNWNQTVSLYLFYMMIVWFCISVIGLVINSKRCRRKDDEFRVSLIFLCIISVFGIIVYLFLF